MQGQTEAVVKERPVKKALEYKYLQDSLVPLNHPVGEDIANLLLGAHLRRGSLLPSFAKAYSKKVRQSVVVVHAAKGATSVDEWLKNSDEGRHRYDKAVDKINKAKAKLPALNKTYFIWLQGESDALKSTSRKDYKSRLTQLKNDLKADCNIDKFMIIKVGYFAYNFGEADKDRVIMKAQEELCKEDSDFLMLTDITSKLSLNKKFINPEATGHYNNLAMRILGARAGKSAAKFRKLSSK